MNREKILNQIRKTYADIYEFTGNFGDTPLCIMDDFCEDAKLSDAKSDFIESLIEDKDPETLSDEVLTQLLQVFIEVVQECKFELQD